MKIIIKHSQRDNWVKYVECATHADFYHSWIYHSLDKSGDPILFVFDDGTNFVAFPLIKRVIPETNVFDCSCVYGYTGPISNKEFCELPEDFISSFQSEFLAYLKSEEIVSVFSRLHPFFNQTPLLEKLGGIYKNGRVVVLDLKQSIDVQRSHYQSRWYRKIKQLKRKGFSVKQSTSSSDVSIFSYIYRDNMMRVNASESYLFSEDYFSALLQSDEVDCRLYFICNVDHTPISGGIIVFTQKVVQVHLLATLGDYLIDSPVKLLIDELSLISRERGMDYINLGGGVGFKEDSLFFWKTKFSDFTPQYHTWRYIVDNVAYQKMLLQRAINPDSGADHFPLYRLRLVNELVSNG